MKLFKITSIVLIMAVLMSGCYWNQTVETGRVGVQMNDGVSVDAVVTPGRYTQMGWYSALEEADVTNKTIAWQDPSLVTKDKQPIGMVLAVTFARKSDSESVKNMFLKYRAEFENDDALITLVNSRIPEVAKSISTRYSLDQLIGIDPNITRDAVSNEMQALLQEKLDEVYVDLVTVQLQDIAPSASFMDLLDQKAAAQIAVELAKQETLKLNEQLNQQKSQTAINIEIAERENKVTEIKSKAYADSPEMLQLKQLELLAGIIGANDKIIYVPAGADLVSVLTGNAGNVVPVPTQP
jgi:hypothetical protein